MDSLIITLVTQTTIPNHKTININDQTLLNFNIKYVIDSLGLPTIVFAANEILNLLP